MTALTSSSKRSFATLVATNTRSSLSSRVGSFSSTLIRLVVISIIIDVPIRIVLPSYKVVLSTVTNSLFRP